MSFVAPYSPPLEGHSRQAGRGELPSAPAIAGGSKDDSCPRTLPRKAKNGLRETRTESSLPTPPRTRDVRLGSRSPKHRSTSPPTSRPARPSFASQLTAPTEEGGLFPSATIEDSSLSTQHASTSSNPFLVQAIPFTSASVHSHSHSPEPSPRSTAPASPVKAEGSQFSPVPPPAPPARARERGQQHQPVNPRKHLDALGPSRRGARRGSSMAIARQETSSAEASSSNQSAKAGPAWDEPNNPFLDGMGLAAKGLVGGARKQRVGKHHERETVTYVFRGVKTEFNNPYYTSPSDDEDADRHPPAITDRRHPDYSPPANPLPRLLFPAASAESDEDDDAPEPLKPRQLAFTETPRKRTPSPLAVLARGRRMDEDEEMEDEIETESEADEPVKGMTLQKGRKRAFGESLAGGESKRMRY